MNELRKKAEQLKACREAERIKELALRVALDHCCEGRGKPTAVAAEIGVSKQYLSDVLHNRRGISTELLEKLCEVGR